MKQTPMMCGFLMTFREDAGPLYANCTRLSSRRGRAFTGDQGLSATGESLGSGESEESWYQPYP